MTRSQRQAIAAHWSRYGIEEEGPLDLQQAFGRNAPRFLEIGFGMGDVLVEMARTQPDWDFLGIDVHEAGIGRLLARVEALELPNVRVWRGDAVEFLSRCVPAELFDTIAVYFPDPWPKKRHHKRRLLQPPFVTRIWSSLRPGGRFHIATDWESYAVHILSVVEAHGGFINTAGPGRFSPRPSERPVSKFERRGQRLGHDVWDLIFERVARPRPAWRAGWAVYATITTVPNSKE